MRTVKQMYRLYIDGKMAGEELKGAWNSPVFWSGVSRRDSGDHQFLQV
jgi:hypothetical protein